MKIVASFLLVFWMLTNLNFNAAFAQSGWETKFEPALLQRMKTGGQHEFLVIFKDQGVQITDSRYLTKSEKGTIVFNQLKRQAAENQAVATAYLQNQKLFFQPFFVVNAIFVKGNLEHAGILAELPEVARIQSNVPIRLMDPVDQLSAQKKDTANIEWGIAMVEADKVWDLGIRGAGVIVAGEDTGYEWTHPAIQPKYRGWEASTQTTDHNFNWHDAIHEISPLHRDSVVLPTNNPCGLNAGTPCDDNSHGTHTMGTMVGENDETKFGMAPDARWIGCRNMERGWGSMATYVECFEWFLAPTDLQNANPDPTKAPHVINNSWYCPELEGCNPANFAIMETAINNLKAAGVVVVVSAGNAGGTCATADFPPSMFENSFSVGATNDADVLAGFSSRGPITIDGSFRIKPNVSAPGVNIFSSVLRGNYSWYSGTSMAGPHVAGLVALIISANPALAGQVEAIETIIEKTAVEKTDSTVCFGHSSENIPNNLYGYGRINAWAAVQKALQWTSAKQIPEKSYLVRLYPNPFRDKLTIQTSDLDHIPFRLSIYDRWGRVIFSDDLESSTEKTIDAGLFQQDVYFWLVRSNFISYSGYLVKIDN